MSWYYYSGSVVRPVQVKPGETRAIRPHSKVEILTMTPEAQAMIRKGILRRTGKPKGAKPLDPTPKKEIKIEDVVQKSRMAQNIAEKGVTSSRNKPPKPVKGSPVELTVGEQAGFEKKKADTVDELSDEDAADSKDEKKDKKKRS
jgi:hypothetical protein